MLPLIIVSALIGVIVSSNGKGSLGSFKAYFVEPILVFFLIQSLLRVRAISRIFVISALFISGIWLSTLAFAQKFVGFPIFAVHEAVKGRAHGVYNTANALGLYLGPLVIIALSLVLYKICSRKNLCV